MTRFVPALALTTGAALVLGWSKGGRTERSAVRSDRWWMLAAAEPPASRGAVWTRRFAATRSDRP